ncbi:MAG: SpoIIE family protein phosphatase [Planctomycetota bacterium]|jgi:serine phosphatase RsbU (regulator of sigma subunit)
MGRTISIRRSLILNIVAVIVILSGAIIVTITIGARAAIRDLSKKIIEQTISQTETKLSSFFDPIENELLRIQTLGRKGLVNLDDFEYLRDQLKAIMRQYPQVTSLMVADESGKDFMMLRNGDKWLIRQMGEKADYKQAKITEWTDDPEVPVTVTWKEVNYDPHQRPWYRGAVSKWNDCADPMNRDNSEQLIYWTKPYQFFTTQEPGMTISARFQQPDGKFCVVGFDVLLTDIHIFMNQLKVLSYGQAVIFTDEDRELIGFAASDHYGNQKSPSEYMLKPIDQLGDPLIDKAMTAFRDRLKRNQKIAGQPIQFKHDKELWWGSVDRFKLASDRNLIMAVIVPNSGILENIQTIRYLLVGITAAVFVLAIWRAKYLASRYSAPIESLVKSSNRMSTGDLEPGAPIVSPVREVVQLAEAHEHMRKGLKTLMKLEGDIQIAREIQQKTLPQSIPQLPGFDIDGWNAPADETGGDTYDIVGYSVDEKTGDVKMCKDAAEQAVLLLADATGHGLGPALSVTQLRAMLRMAVHIQPTVGTIVEHMNEQLCMDLPEGRFITAWFGRVDAAAGCVRYFSAGQAPLLHYIAAEDTVRVLDADTFPLGIFEPLGSTEVQQVDMEAGDIFAVISDGIYEAVDPEEEQFGNDRVIEIIKKNRDKSSKEISETIRAATDEYTQNAPPDDDRTIVIIKRV